ncbi:hypothetical protein A2886_00745 [candidate division WWE3 bacterium RIFCSPHIGHO2_01_FULL_42_13]|uniref:Uncharacterized protein n=1 Tax=candidate division WWE3 bacterium RIFCSPHIGHO2_01_FULL_42_13 TaxID=1802617 RepID=A0A1F4UQC6_UNCKA|nr:MAG: hypothetical protein A2886_00745 [candidate division WWE3 bacterium RIFCSPHIGHO2_01_FULL_42_13]
MVAKSMGRSVSTNQKMPEARAWAFSILVSLVLWLAVVMTTFFTPEWANLRVGLWVLFTISMGTMLVLFGQKMEWTSREDQIFIWTGLISAILGSISAIVIIYGIPWVGEWWSIPLVQIFLGAIAVLGGFSDATPKESEDAEDTDPDHDYKI